MKKLFLFTFVMFFVSSQYLMAQEKEPAGLFKHLGIGASVGTDGIGFDVATLVTDYAAIRAGVSFWPKIAMKTDINIKDNNPLIADKVTLEGKVNIFDFKLLADVYPFKHSSFHLTAGMFLGNGVFLKGTNTTMFIKDPSKYGKLGLIVGDYRIATDEKGYIQAEAKSNKLKPYLGFGFGRAVPRNSRVSVSCDFGVEFWGKPGVYAWTKNDWDDKVYHKFTVDDLDQYDDKHIKDALDAVDKIKIFPVLNIRLNGRIF